MENNWQERKHAHEHLLDSSSNLPYWSKNFKRWFSILLYVFDIWNQNDSFSFKKLVYIFRAQEPKAPMTYCDHALSGVRPSVVRPSSIKLFTFSTSSPEPLDGFWWNLVWMKYSRSLTSVVVFSARSVQGRIQGGAKIGHGGVPFFRKLLLQTGRLQQQTECIAVI